MRDRPLEDVLARAERMIDPRSGIIASLDEIPFPPGYENQMYAYSAMVGDV